MISIHEKTAQTFETLGMGALLPSSCVITEELNGAYELEMEHPYDSDGKWERIERGRILYASTPMGKQPFRIYSVKPDMKGIVVNARHIFYDLLDNHCSNIAYNGSAATALNRLKNAFAYPMPFTFDTDVTEQGKLVMEWTNPVEMLLSEDENSTSFVKGFDYEILRDHFKVSLLKEIGQNRDVVIRYGKNLIGLEITEDESEVKTRIVCKGRNGTVTVNSKHINDYVYPKIYMLEDTGKTT
ncbi:MAG: phage tail protein, partial [Anaerotignum sp.]|nr:phage tail protein [Anaerotignum sp.]